MELKELVSRVVRMGQEKKCGTKELRLRIMELATAISQDMALAKRERISI